MRDKPLFTYFNKSKLLYSTEQIYGIQIKNINIIIDSSITVKYIELFI